MGMGSDTVTGEWGTFGMDWNGCDLLLDAAPTVPTTAPGPDVLTPTRISLLQEKGEGPQL